MSLQESIQREAEQLKSFFKENIELAEYDLRHTYMQFRLKAVDGIPVKSKILLDFYNDRTYMPMDARQNYAGKLDVFIMGQLFPGKESCIGSHSIPFSKSDFQNRANNKISIVDFVQQASAYMYEPYNAHSGRLVRSSDPEYAVKRCLEHLGRKASLDNQISDAKAFSKPSSSKTGFSHDDFGER